MYSLLLLHQRLLFQRDFSLQMKLPFEFPFYGHQLADITICTGGYVFTGATSHLWLAQDQSISPLMANFDVSLDDSSSVVLYEEGMSKSCLILNFGKFCDNG